MVWARPPPMNPTPRRHNNSRTTTSCRSSTSSTTSSASSSRAFRIPRATPRTLLAVHTHRLRERTISLRDRLRVTFLSSRGLHRASRTPSNASREARLRQATRNRRTRGRTRRTIGGSNSRAVTLANNITENIKRVRSNGTGTSSGVVYLHMADWNIRVLTLSLGFFRASAVSRGVFVVFLYPSVSSQ